MRWYSLDERSDRPGAIFGKRIFAHWGPEDADRSAHLEVWLRRKSMHGWGGYLRFDGPHAETPIDAAVFLGPFSAFFGSSIGRRLNKILRVRKGSREISFQVSNGDGFRRWTYLTAQFCLWVDREHQTITRWQRRNGGFSRWYLMRRGYCHPVDRALTLALGKTAYRKDTLGRSEAVGYLEDGVYPLDLELVRQTWRRPRSWRKLERLSVEWSVRSVADGGPGGCPTGSTKFGRDGGLVGSGVEVDQYQARIQGKWTAAGVAGFTKSALEERARHGWRPKVDA